MNIRFADMGVLLDKFVGKDTKKNLYTQISLDNNTIKIKFYRKKIILCILWYFILV